MKIVEKIIFAKILLSHLYHDFLYTKSFMHDYEDEEVAFTKLRAQAHILDKGMHIIPFEKGHGKNIYQQCKILQNKITDSRILNDSAFKWADRVIKNYENAQKTGVVSLKTVVRSQFTNEDKEQFFNVIRSRTSCRSFTNEIIDDTLWNEIIEIASDAPSGCCRYTARYYIENDREKIRLLIKNIAGATGFNGDIPYLVCVTSDTRGYSIKGRFLPYIDVSLSVENFILASTVSNISCVCLNIQDASLPEIRNVKEILNIPDHEKIIIFIAAGRPGVLPEKPERLNSHWVRKNSMLI